MRIKARAYLIHSSKKCFRLLSMYAPLSRLLVAFSTDPELLFFLFPPDRLA
jgi:hypothetical protein